MNCPACGEPGAYTIHGSTVTVCPKCLYSIRSGDPGEFHRVTPLTVTQEEGQFHAELILPTYPRETRVDVYGATVEGVLVKLGKRIADVLQPWDQEL